jgi:TolB-like protein
MKLTKLVLFLLTLLLSACATNDPFSDRTEKESDLYKKTGNNLFIENNYKAADSLISQFAGELTTTQPIIVATVVDIDALSTSSTFGRLVSEQVSAKFSKSKYTMIEMKFGSDIYMKADTGELLLTREIKNVARNQNAQAVIVGTYAKAGNVVFVNLKVIQPNTNIVMAVHDYAFPMDENLKKMLGASDRK